MFGRFPREVIADGDRIARCFPTLLLLTWHPLGLCLLDQHSKARFRSLTCLMAKGALPLGFVGMDENLDLVALVPLAEFREARWAIELLHQAYCERGCRNWAPAAWSEDGALCEVRFARPRDIAREGIFDATTP